MRSSRRRTVEKRGARAWTIAFGVAWGCAAATKFTGWFLPFPLAAWALSTATGGLPGP